MNAFYFSRPSPQRLHVSHSAPNLQPALIFPRNPSQLNIPPDAIPLSQVTVGPLLPQQQFQRRNEITPLRNIQFSGQKHAYYRLPTNQFPVNVPRSSPQWQLFKSFELGMKALDKIAPINPDKYFSESDSRSYSKYSKVRLPFLKKEIIS
jgi:hypothetical protein